MKRRYSNQLQSSSLDSFLVTVKRRKNSVDAPATITTADVEVTGSSELEATTSVASSIIAIHSVDHEITEPRNIIDSEIQNRIDSHVDIVVPISENDQISTEPGPATATIATTFSCQIPNVVFINDIGNFVGTNIDNLTKKNLLTSPWKPSADYNMPYSVHMKKNKQEKRYLNHSHLEQYEWLVYSDSKKGLFCKYCSLFSYHLTVGSHKQVALQKLVKQPLQMFAKLFGKDGHLTMHDQATYHKEAVEAGRNFFKNYNETQLEHKQ